MLTQETPVEQLLTEASDKFRSTFGTEPKIAACAPGRVNLIGEHTDYNNGFVLPMALPFVTVIVGSYNSLTECRVVSMAEMNDDEKLARFPTHAPHAPLTPGPPSWSNYVKGVIANFPGEVNCFDAVIVTSVPIGGGVSSSASLEVGVFTFLEALTERKCDATTKALACQKAEHHFAGMPCGIMDQFISTMGKKDNALLIDCRSLSSRLIPLKSDDIVILVTNSNVKHKLSGSEYPTRRAQCQKAAELLGKDSLRDAHLSDITELKKLSTDPVVVQRAEHVIKEISRTLEATKCLEEGNFKRVGELFYESHYSLKDLFEVSCKELDELVEAAKTAPGVLGSRMTGGGFGGCTVTLVYKEHVEEAVKIIKSKYSGNPTFYVCKPGNGARILNF